MTIFAMLFPGQGSQYTGMLSSFFKRNYIFRNTFNEASHYIETDIFKLAQEGPKKIINTSKYTQVIILTASVSIYRYWQQQNGKSPIFMSGHSLGEYSALVCANALKFSDAVKIVFLRGELMQKSIIDRPSAMCAINGLNEKEVKKICSFFSQNNVVSLSNINSTTQIVISGDKEAVKKASIYCKKKGAKSIHNLNINIPAHCQLMQPISEKFREILNQITIRPPIIPIINNVDVKCQSSAENIIDALIRQIYSPVRWKEIINFMLSRNVSSMLEIGPNKILTNLNKSNKNITAMSTNNFKNFLIAFQKINKKL